MKTVDVIKRPILSEKAYKLMESGLYTFLIGKNATKQEVAEAVAQHYSVEVKRVNVSKIQPKAKRIAKTRKTTNVGGGKKATVWLKKGHSITSLLPKSDAKKSKKASGEKEIEKAEGKEG